MKYAFGFIVVALCLAASPAFAVAQQSIYTVYYDANGNQIGESWANCANQHGSTGTTTGDLFTQEITPCQSNIQPISCEDVGLVSTECPQYCVTSGFYMSVAVSQAFPDPFGCIHP